MVKITIIVMIFEPKYRVSVICMPIMNNITVSQKEESYLAQKGDQHSVVMGDIQNNPTLADFSYHIRMTGFLALKFEIFAMSVLFFHFS